jgi:hypothetical protein
MTDTNDNPTTEQEPVDLDGQIQKLLAKNRQVAAIWSIEDVKGVRPHLTDEQAWEVLQQVGDIHDAEYGITWMTLETVADDMFPNRSSVRRRS